MREIKFRGLKIHGGGWAYGYLVRHINGKCFIFPGSYDQVPGTQHFDWHFIEVVPESTGQHAGLNDKSGKEIYEGDVVAFWPRKNEKPVGPHKGAVVCLHTFEGFIIDLRGSDYMDLGYKAYEYEVVGNIYENPELLKS